jgi:hypothetical protein
MKLIPMEVGKARKAKPKGGKSITKTALDRGERAPGQKAKKTREKMVKAAFKKR